MKTTTIKNTWLNDSDLRVDASFHLSDGVKTKRIIEKLCPYPKTKLKDEAIDLFKGNIHKRVNVSSPEHGYMFFTASDLFKSELDSGKYVSKKHSPYLKELELKKDWILITRSGTLGNVFYTTSDLEGKIGTDDLVRIKPKEKNIRRGYMYAYLSSRYGYGLLTQSSYGGVVKHIEPHHIKDLPIPILPQPKQQDIHNLIVEAANLRVEANRLLKEATSYFDKYYRVDKFTKVFSKKLSCIDFSWASYNNNIECDMIENSFDDYIRIGDVATNCFAPPLFKHIYLSKDNGHPFFTGAEITKFLRKKYRWLSPRGVKNIEDYKVNKGTLLLYKSGTTDGGILGNVFIVDDVLDGSCLSDHVIRITTKELKTSYWLYAFLKSSAGIKLLQKMATGSMIPFITPDRLLSVKVPKPDKQIDWMYEKIDGYIQFSSESHRKELQAIDLVEKEIESWQK